MHLAGQKNNFQKQSPVSVGFVSLGCPKNVVDAEKMLAIIAQAGFVLDYDIESADVVVINTCGFIRPAIQEAEDVISEIVSLKKINPRKKIIVAGCLAQRAGEELLNQFPQIDAVMCLGARDDIVDVINNAIAGGPIKFYQSGDEWTARAQNDADRLLINSAHWAYLRISEGCERNCSFCTIPAIKGRFRSKPMDEVVAEANQLAEAGIVELSIIAQDSSNYGSDIGIKNGLVRVIAELEKIEKLKWIRLMYLNPYGIGDELIETIAKSEKVVKYIDMPIQHINDEILKAMHRPDSHEKIAALIEKIRKAIPDVVLRTTVIVGFPGETDKQFAELLDFVNAARFDALGCFSYWPEDGTKAAAMENQIAEEVKQQRNEQIMLAQQKIAFEKNEARKGEVLECLIDEKTSKKNAIGRYFGQAPHIDSVCFVGNCKSKPGSFVKAKVTGFEGYDLVLEL